MGRARGILAQNGEVRNHKGPLSKDVLRNVNSIWFCGPRGDLAPDESSALHSFMREGGAVIVCGNDLPQTFVEFIGGLGVTISDRLISPVYVTNISPGLVSVQGGLINRAVPEFVGEPEATFLFPNGSTLDVRDPSVPFLTSGMTGYPSGRPIASYAQVGTTGSLLVLGAAQTFADDYIKQECNEKLLSFVVAVAITRTVKLNDIEARNPDVTERLWVPDIAGLAEQLRSCIQESEGLHADIRENFDRAVFHMDMGYIAAASELASTVGIKNEQLQTIRPQFDQALPRLIPAVFPPQMREPPGPRLELFDLDEAFASSKTRLAQLAQRTPARNLEKFIIQSAKILGILPQLPEGKKDGKHVLQHVFAQISKYKQAV